MSPKAGLIAAALSAHLGVELKSEEDAKKIASAAQAQGLESKLVPLKISSIFRHLYNEVRQDDAVTIGVNSQAQANGILSAGLSAFLPVLLPIASIFRHLYNEVRQDDAVTIRVLHRDDLQFRVNPNKTVGELKEWLAGRVGLHPASQVLSYGGTVLANDLSLSNLPTGVCCLLQWGPAYDCDFTNVKDDGVTFMRGGKEYRRPCGWDRCALAVLDKYSDNKWLGPDGIRTGSDPDEWAVSYHGTAKENIRPIAKCGYDPEKLKNGVYGWGFYSSPYIHEAEGYARRFEYPAKSGKYFKVVLQNRVKFGKNPATGEDYTTVENDGKYYVTKTTDDHTNYIRPYGVCLKKVKWLTDCSMIGAGLGFWTVLYF